MGRDVILSIQHLQALYNTTLSDELLKMFNLLDLAALVLETKIQRRSGRTPRASDTQMTPEEIQSLHRYFQMGRLDLAIGILEKKYRTVHIAAEVTLTPEEEMLISHCFMPLYEIPDVHTQPEQVQIQIEARQRHGRALLHRLQLLHQQQSEEKSFSSPPPP